MCCAGSLAACTSGHTGAPVAARTPAAVFPSSGASSGTSSGASSGTGAASATSDAAAPPSAAAVEAKVAQILAEITIGPLPSFSVPTDLLTSAAGRHIASLLHAQPGLYAGIGVLDDRCSSTGSAPADAAAPGAARTGSAGGTYDAGGVHVFLAGDGTGNYRDGALQVSVLPGGAGVFDDGKTRVSVAADGSGSYVSASRRMAVNADGTGSYRSGDTRLAVAADGSASFDAGRTHVSVSAAGVVFTRGDPVTTAAVLQVIRHRFPLFPPVPRVVRVHPSGTVCGTVVRLDANVLFDFGSATLTPAGSALLTRVAHLLTALGRPPVQVNGYTDHLGAAAANVTLSQRRAGAVCAGLKATGVPAGQLRASGFGDTHPLGPEVTAGGKDDPAARQLDRRVELVLPTTASGAPSGAPTECG